MRSDIVELVGYAAASLTTLSFVPQVIKTWRSKSAGDLSLGMLTAFAAGVLLWILYGLARGSGPVVIANVITLIFSGVLIALTQRYAVRRVARPLLSDKQQPTPTLRP